MKSALTVLLLALLNASANARDLTLPDPILTPGATVDISVEDICSRKWGKDARFVTKSMKVEVFRLYGMSGNGDESCEPDTKGRRCEIDHLISRELGGADHVLNLWPQPYGTSPWNATRKDRVENRLHKELCMGKTTLTEARWWISTDYRVPYVRYFGQPKEK